MWTWTRKISGRICRYTYGVKKNIRFDRANHPQLKKVIRNNIEYCDDIFDIHVRVGQTVEVGEPQVKKTYSVAEHDQTVIDFEILTSNNKEPTYTTDEGCTRLGTFKIDLPDTSKGLDRKVIVYMTFSGTEIAVTAVDKDNPERAVTTTVDFLGWCEEPISKSRSVQLKSYQKQKDTDDYLMISKINF